MLAEPFVGFAPGGDTTSQEIDWTEPMFDAFDATSLEDLWDSARPTGRFFDSALLRHLPDGARRYLEHAIATGTSFASAVRLRMHGEIKLKAWYPFSGEQVICRNRGMVWRAAVRVRGATIRGGDLFVDGHGAMRWRLFGIIPIVRASGPDIDRSAAGRFSLESLWLPSLLCDDEISWSAADPRRPHAVFTTSGEPAKIDYTIDDAGRLQAVSMPRWGNPGGGPFRYVACGAFVQKENTFSGYTIPTRLRVGWHFGTERFETEGEFFRVTIKDAEFR